MRRNYVILSDNLTPMHVLMWGSVKALYTQGISFKSWQEFFKAGRNHMPRRLLEVR